MNEKTTRALLMASSVITGVVLVISTGANAAAADATAATVVQEMVVTGSRIPQPNLTSVSPVSVINSDQIQASGVTRVEDIINQLPQAFAAQGSNISNGSSGTATVNLRGLGCSRTLVLIDGKRLMPGDPSLPCADINFIPDALISRVDVLTGGSSAAYGSDAMSGVVNFVMRRDLEGIRFDAQVSEFVHTNGDTSLQTIIKAKSATASVPSQYSLPPSNVQDGLAREFTLSIGANSPDGKGNVTAFAGYRYVDPVLQGARDYSTCTLNSGAAFTCGGSGTAFPTRVGSYLIDPTTGNSFRARNSSTDVYNYGPTNYYQRPDERFSLGAFAHYKVEPWLEAYADVMFMEDKSTYQIAPGGYFAGARKINCDNPYLDAALANSTTAVAKAICTPADIAAGTVKTFTIARRDIEGGTRDGAFDHIQFRYILGVKGDLGDNWSYDAYGQYGRVTFHETQSGFFMSTKEQNALLVHNVGGVPTCDSVVSGTDTKCVPINLFKNGGITQAAVDYLSTDTFSGGSTTEQLADVSITGKLGAYGVKSPWASEGAAINLGGETRSEHLDYAADYVARAGLLDGSGGASPSVANGYHVTDLFGELRLPLINDMPFAKLVDFTAGYRYSHYSTGQDTDTYKFAFNYEPVAGYRLRASYQRAARAANILELYSPQNVVLDGTTDPCAGLSAGSANVAKCMTAFGYTQAQVLAIENNPAPQYNGLTGGNPNLKPEVSDTYSIGAVIQPPFVPGMSFSIDYFNIKVNNYISGIGADTIISRCVDTANPYFCNLVHRDTTPGSFGSLFLSPAGYVVDTTLNTGYLETKGLDFEFNYKKNLSDLGLGDHGSLALNFVATYLMGQLVQSLPGDTPYDCAGFYGTQCGSPNPTFRSKTRLTWNTPWSGLTASIQWRHYNAVAVDCSSSDPQLSCGFAATDAKLGAVDYFDINGAIKIKDRYRFRFGVNNLFDKDPPIIGGSSCPTGACSGNTYAQVYDTLGRYVFVGLTADF